MELISQDKSWYWYQLLITWIWLARNLGLADNVQSWVLVVFIWCFTMTGWITKMIKSCDWYLLFSRFEEMENQAYSLPMNDISAPLMEKLVSGQTLNFIDRSSLLNIIARDLFRQNLFYATSARANQIAAELLLHWPHLQMGGSNIEALQYWSMQIRNTMRNLRKREHR